MKHFGLVLLLGSLSFSSVCAMEKSDTDAPINNESDYSQAESKILKIYKDELGRGIRVNSMRVLKEKEDEILSLIRKIPEAERNELRLKIDAIHQRALMHTSLIGSGEDETEEFNHYLNDLFSKVTHSPKSLQDLAREKVSAHTLSKEKYSHLRKQG